MLIDKLVIPANELNDVGLKQISMSRLGRFVALTGKNGAGKTRILTKLNQVINKRNSNIGNVESLRNQIKGFEEAIKTQPRHPNLVNWQEQLRQFQDAVASVTERIFPVTTQVIGVVQFVPKQLNLSDSRGHNKQAMLNLFSQAQNPGFSGFELSCFSYIQRVQDREWAASHQRATIEPKIKESAKEEYENLVYMIQKLLKSKLERSLDDDATLFGKPLAEAGLSDGQKVIIQLAVALHAQNKKLDNTVFLLDEPENHLHPSALIEFLDALEAVAQNSQLWIATHSVPLLAHIANKEPMSIWYVEDGEVNNAGSKPEKVLRGLLGNDEQIDNLNTFTSLPAQYAAISFAAECLLEPKTVGDATKDPQVAQINAMLSLDATTPIMLLDYGAGKSRLLSGLAEIAAAKGMSITDSVSYFSFEPAEADIEYSKATIEASYGEGIRRHFQTADDYFSSNENESIDVVVMCNVLHEIQPEEWIKLFDEHSLIGRSLKKSGSLLLVEDQRIPTGEKAHKYGFLVLDTPHLRTLFSVRNEDVNNGLFQTSDYRGDGRLKAHKISKALLGRLSSETRKEAIVQLRETAKLRITALRDGTPDYRNGQLHGFWTQQFANASLWLDHN